MSIVVNCFLKSSRICGHTSWICSERERAHLADDLGGARDQDMGAQENCRLRTMNVICGLMPSSVQASACLSNVELGMKVTKRTLKER